MLGRIAVIDDHEPFLNLMTAILDEEGYAVIPISKAHDAYGVIARERPDLILLDIRMGEPQAGWVILESLRANPDFSATPIVVCTADERFVREKRDDLVARKCEILEKPFEVEELLSAVESALAGTKG